MLLVNLTATLAFAELAGESLQVGMPNPDRFGPQRVVLADAIPSQPGSLLQNPWLVAILVGGVGALKLLVEGGTKKKRSRREKKAPRSAATVARPTTKTPAAEKQPGTFADLSWDEFEMLVGEIYRREGYSVQMLAAAGADGGIDLTLKR